MRLTAFFLLAVLGTVATLPLTASAQQYPSVVIDGSPMGFPDQPPVERGGRIFVPMRAIFQRLGATVVYQNGTINATRGGRTVQLQIGSPVATVNGQQIQLDSPPFEIAGRTLVPLRFVSQTLGSRVSWDQNRATAYIMTGGGMANPGNNNVGYNNGGNNNGNNNNGGYNGGYNNGGYTATWLAGSHAMFHRPFPWGQTTRRYPMVHANFRVPMRPGTVTIRLDGRDVTNEARVTPMGFTFTPSYRLDPGMHRVFVYGMTLDGRRFTDGWSFRIV